MLRRRSRRNVRRRVSGAVRTYVAPKPPQAVPVFGGREIPRGWGKWVAIGGAAALGYFLYSKFRGALQTTAPGAGPSRASLFPTGIRPGETAWPGGSSQQFMPGVQPQQFMPGVQPQQFMPGGQPISPSRPPVGLKPGVTITETAPGVLQMTTPEGKKKKLAPKQIEQMLPSMVYVRNQWIPMPNDTGKKGMEKLDAQQDLCDIGTIRGWLIQVGTGKAGVPQYSPAGSKKKMARAAAAKYVKAKLVQESLSGQLYATQYPAAMPAYPSSAPQFTTFPGYDQEALLFGGA